MEQEAEAPVEEPTVEEEPTVVEEPSIVIYLRFCPRCLEIVALHDPDVCVHCSLGWVVVPLQW